MQVVLFLTSLIVCNVLSSFGAPPANSIPVKIVNRANAALDLHWINTFEVHRPLVRQVSKPIRNNSDTTINSYDTHEFLISYYDKKLSNFKHVTFVKGSTEETVTVYSNNGKEPGNLQLVKTTKYDNIKDTIKGATIQCAYLQDPDDFDACLADIVAIQVNELETSISELRKYRNRIAEKLRNYTCADTSLNSTEPLFVETMGLGGKSGRKEMNVEVETHLNLPASKIWVAHNFVTEDECDVLMKYGNPRLKRATIAAEDGTSIISTTRKAQQASYNFPQNNPDKDPLWDLYNRIFEFVNIKTPYNISPPGQEEFAIIQYNEEDEYGAHCDADCAGETFTTRGRVATAVLYCKVAEKGGGTSFSKADVFVKPRKGDVTFFAYKGDDNLMDTGYTEHSGCPIIQGEKWITTAWLRQGVTKEDPWNDYDPSGIPIFYTENVEQAETVKEFTVEATA
jgi:hypothetical protein